MSQTRTARRTTQPNRRPRAVAVAVDSADHRLTASESALLLGAFLALAASMVSLATL